MNKSKDILTITILSVITLAIFAYSFLPLRVQITALKDDLHKERVILAQQKKQNENIVALSRQFNETQENAKKLEGALIAKDTEELIGLIDAIEKKAAELKIKEELTIPVIPDPKDKETQSSQLSLTLNGKESSVYAMLYFLETQEVYFSFESLEIVQVDNEVRANLVGSIYWK